jgi:hypothetical protein
MNYMIIALAEQRFEQLLDECKIFRFLETARENFILKYTKTFTYTPSGNHSIKYMKISVDEKFDLQEAMYCDPLEVGVVVANFARKYNCHYRFILHQRLEDKVNFYNNYNIVRHGNLHSFSVDAEEDQMVQNVTFATWTIRDGDYEYPQEQRFYGLIEEKSPYIFFKVTYGKFIQPYDDQYETDHFEQTAFWIDNERVVKDLQFETRKVPINL